MVLASIVQQTRVFPTFPLGNPLSSIPYISSGSIPRATTNFFTLANHSATAVLFIHLACCMSNLKGDDQTRLTAVQFGPGSGVFCLNLEPTGSIRMADFLNLNLPPNLRFTEVQEVQQPGGVMYQILFFLCLKSSIFQWLVALTRLSKHSIPSRTLQVQPHSCYIRAFRLIDQPLTRPCSLYIQPLFHLYPCMFTFTKHSYYLTFITSPFWYLFIID